MTEERERLGVEKHGVRSQSEEDRLQGFPDPFPGKAASAEVTEEGR